MLRINLPFSYRILKNWKSSEFWKNLRNIFHRDENIFRNVQILEFFNLICNSERLKISRENIEKLKKYKLQEEILKNYKKLVLRINIPFLHRIRKN